MHQESKKPQRQRATEQSSKASFTKGREHFVLVQNRMADKYGTPQYIIGSRKAYPGPTLPEKTIELLEAASEASESAKASYQETNDFGVLVVDMWSGFAKALFPKQEKLIDRGAEIGRDYYSDQDKK
ncbi:MAG: hypothetical protein F9K49_07155 [Caedimonadaceae bacterium]|nr:MAG: hypothetical protein F9K49_07155 [Caedimonadaceae bacterium]